MLATRPAVVAAALAIGFAGAACSDDDDGSQTPEISIDENVSVGFLTADDLSSISGFEDVETQSFEEFPVFENPDLRGPCGAEVAPISFDGASGQALGGSSIVIVQFSLPTTTELQAYLNELAADEGPPCGPYRSTTNTGNVQTVSDITVYGLDSEDVAGIAWTSLIEVEGSFAYAGLVFLQTEETTTLVQIQSATPIPEVGIQFLTEAATVRLLDASDDG